MFKQHLPLYFIALCLLMSVGAISLPPSLNKTLNSYLEEKGFEGAALIAKDGQILLKKGYGFANREHQILNTPETVFRIASLTKQITAMAILRLEEEKLLHLQDPISKYLPDYPQGEKITIHHLLSHSSGIANITDLPNLAELQRHPLKPKELMSLFNEIPLKFTPGTSCEYSNSGYIVLGAIIELITGQSYGDYIEGHILAPLKMHSTCQESTRLIPRKASGYVKKDEQIEHASFLDMSFTHASGDLVSTVEDLYCLSLELKKPKYKAMLTLHAENSENLIAYGYGMRIGPQNKGMEGCLPSIRGHFGGIEGFAAASIYYPDEDLTIILLSNIENMPVRAFHKDLSNLVLSSWRR